MINTEIFEVESGQHLAFKALKLAPSVGDVLHLRHPAPDSSDAPYHGTGGGYRVSSVEWHIRGNMNQHMLVLRVAKLRGVP